VHVEETQSFARQVNILDFALQDSGLFLNYFFMKNEKSKKQEK